MDDMNATQILEAEGQQSQDGAAPNEGSQDMGQPIDGAQQQASQQTNDWNPDQFQLKYRDTVVKPESREQLISLAQQGYSYSQRMHELNEREQQLNAQQAQYAQYQQLEEAFAKNPAFRQQILNYYNNALTPQQQQQQQNGTAGAQQLPPEIVQQIQGLTEFKNNFETYQQQQQAQQADQEVMSEVQSLQTKYKRDDWETPNSNGLTLIQEVVKHALDNGGIKLETAFRDIMFDQHTQNAQAEALKQQANSQQAARKAGIVSSGKNRGSTPPKEVNPASMDYNQIEKMIKSEYGITS